METDDIVRPIVDFHCHSTASDGALSPQDVYSRACDNGVDKLALTDHDTIAGCVALKQALDSGELTKRAQLISGIELSCVWNKRGIHIVGLGFDLDSEVMEAAVARQTEVRNRRAVIIGERLEKLGFAGCFEGAMALANGCQIGRPHFAQFMLQQGYVTTINQAFNKYLGAGKPGDVKSGWPTLDEAVGWIVQSGGVAVVAHPERYKLTRTKLCQLLQSFVDAGGQGIEMAGKAQHINTQRDIAKLCTQYQLMASVGSDFHNPEYRWNDLAQVPAIPAQLTPIWQHVNAVVQ
jgi:hypothetical protein